MITVSKTLFSQNGSQVEINLSRQDILNTTPQFQEIQFRETFETPEYLDELAYLSEDGHGYSIIDINNIDTIDEDMI